MQNQLIEYLDNVLENCDLVPMNGFEKAINGPCWYKIEEGKQLLNFISNCETYNEFNEKLQTLGNSANEVDYLKLTDWLVERSSIVGSKVAEEELNNYLTNQDFEAYALMLLGNTNIDNCFIFANGTEIIKAENFDNKHLNRSIYHNRFSNLLPLPNTNNYIIVSFKQKKCHFSNIDSDFKMPTTDIPFSKLEETMLCISISRPIGFGVQSIANGVVVKDDVPILSSISGWYMNSFKMPPIAPPIIDFELRKANSYLEKILKLKPAVKTRILSIIKHFNNFNSGAPIEERSIELRICLESIFLSDNKRDKLRYTLATRASLFLGNDENEKQTILKIMKKAYDVTSCAVHTGKMPKKNVELLPDAAEIARKAILKIIDEGDVNWKLFELKKIHITHIRTPSVNRYRTPWLRNFFS